MQSAKITWNVTRYKNAIYLVPVVISRLECISTRNMVAAYKFSYLKEMCNIQPCFNDIIVVTETWLTNLDALTVATVAFF